MRWTKFSDPKSSWEQQSMWWRQAQRTAEGHQGCVFGYPPSNFVEWKMKYVTRAELLWAMVEWLTPSTSCPASSLPVCRAHSLSGKRNSCPGIRTSALFCLRWKRGETVSSCSIVLYPENSVFQTRSVHIPTLLSTCKFSFRGIVFVPASLNTCTLWSQSLPPTCHLPHLWLPLRTSS